MKILVTGGAGYIGSHTCVQLLESGHDVVVIDNLSNSSEKSLERVEELTGKRLSFYKGDIRDEQLLDQIFAQNKIDAVIHFAGLKAVGESMEMPLEYYMNNMHGTMTLLDSMRKNGCKSIVFSSSATVYGTPKTNPITEEFAVGDCTNPYGKTKYMIEEILEDVHKSDKEWNIVIFRYFNPTGAHPSGKIGEDPAGIPNNLMPYITQVALGKLEKLHVFGNDYETVDGTGVRDFIHVVDLAEAHVKALDLFDRKNDNVNLDARVYNLGTGKGTSVLELIDAFKEATKADVPFVIEGRRPGDVAECYCDASKAYEELGWKAKYDVYDMCRDSWNWQSQNPNGYL